MKISKFFLFLIICSCGFSPLYSKKNIIESSIYNSTKIFVSSKYLDNKIFNTQLTSYLNKRINPSENSTKNYKLNVIINKNITSSIRESSGDFSRQRITISAKVELKDSKNKTIRKIISSKSSAYDISDIRWSNYINEEYELNELVKSIGENIISKLYI